MKDLIGKVSALSGINTAKVSIVRQWTHPLYKKSVKRTKYFACHTEMEGLEIGDVVKITACRPMSKTKRFKIVEKVEVQGENKQ